MPCRVPDNVYLQNRPYNVHLYYSKALVTSALAHIPDWMYKFFFHPGILSFHLENEEFPLFSGECMARNPQISPSTPDGSVWLWWDHDEATLTSWVPCP